MGTITQDASSAGMATAIEANLNATFSLLTGRQALSCTTMIPTCAGTSLPRFPTHSLTTSTSQNSPKRRMLTPGSRNSESTLPHINSP